ESRDPERRARPRVSDADADGPVRPDRGARRRGDLSRVGRRQLRHRTIDSRRRRLPRQRGQPVNREQSAGGRGQTVIVISTADNVATALEAIDAGQRIEAGAAAVTASEPIPRGHKIALRDIRAGDTVVKYGSPIGTAS